MDLEENGCARACKLSEEDGASDGEMNNDAGTRRTDSISESWFSGGFMMRQSYGGKCRRRSLEEVRRMKASSGISTAMHSSNFFTNKNSHNESSV